MRLFMNSGAKSKPLPQKIVSNLILKSLNFSISISSRIIGRWSDNIVSLKSTIPDVESLNFTLIL